MLLFLGLFALLVLLLVIGKIAECCNEFARRFPTFRRCCRCNKLPGDTTDEEDNKEELLREETERQYSNI